MKPRVVVTLLICLLTVGSFAGELKNGVLMVDGKPFFPLGSWPRGYTTGDDITKLGMNTVFRPGPRNQEGVDDFRQQMQQYRQAGLQVVLYLSYGGETVRPWEPEAVRTISKLANESNLLAWYIGDDIQVEHLPGIERTSTILRDETPTIPVVADYIGEETQRARQVYKEHIDIRCNYTYPLPDKPFSEYLAFFDHQRDLVGDPLWTWIQSFMWDSTAKFLNAGDIGPGPLPDPEQVRLLSFAAINRGVRGLLYFSHHELHRLPELAAEVALMCHEIRLFSEHLAAGAAGFDLPTSHEQVGATAFQYGDSTVISAALFKSHYHHYVDKGVLDSVTIDCPWADAQLPQAFLVATPDVVECRVDSTSNEGIIRITVPRFELAGFILVSSNPREIAALRVKTRTIPKALRTLMLPAAAAQSRKVMNYVWKTGVDGLRSSSPRSMDVMRAVDTCAEATVEGRYAEACTAWRQTLHGCRIMIGEAMQFAAKHREYIPQKYHKYLDYPYGLHLCVQGARDLPSNDTTWRYNRNWMLAGPFPREDDEHEVRVGDKSTVPPQTVPGPGVTFDTVDGPSQWRLVRSESIYLNLLDFLKTTDRVTCYLRCEVSASRQMETKLRFVSSEDARIWLNRRMVYPSADKPTIWTEGIVPIHLGQGKNDLLIETKNNRGSWRFALAIYDPEGEVKFKAE